MNRRESAGSNPEQLPPTEARETPPEKHGEEAASPETGKKTGKEKGRPPEKNPEKESRPEKTKTIDAPPTDEELDASYQEMERAAEAVEAMRQEHEETQSQIEELREVTELPKQVVTTETARSLIEAKERLAELETAVEEMEDRYLDMPETGRLGRPAEEVAESALEQTEELKELIAGSKEGLQDSRREFSEKWAEQSIQRFTSRFGDLLTGSANGPRAAKILAAKARRTILAAEQGFIRSGDRMNDAVWCKVETSWFSGPDGRKTRYITGIDIVMPGVHDRMDAGAAGKEKAAMVSEADRSDLDEAEEAGALRKEKR